MNSAEFFVMLMLALGIANAHARLPPPSPEEKAAMEQKKAAQQAQLEKEKKQLEAAQDRVVQHYRKTKGKSADGGDGGKVRDENMPKTTKELPGGVGPKPTQPQSGEAHSAPAK